METEQRTNDWFRQRLGHITASECYVLMKEHKEPMTAAELEQWKAENPKSRVTTKTVPFSDATYTYLNRKVMENYLPINSKAQESINAVDEYIDMHSVGNKATQYGTDLEPVARNRYAEQMGYEVFEVGFTPYKKYPKLAGGSPDGALREEKGIIEIKCPFTLEKHLQHLLYHSPREMKENDEQYYWQCYMNMLVTDTDFCDFISFNPYISSDLQLKVLRIKRNEEEMELLRQRIELAVEYIKEQINNIEQAIKIKI